MISSTSIMPSSLLSLYIPQGLLYMYPLRAVDLRWTLLLCVFFCLMCIMAISLPIAMCLLLLDVYYCYIPHFLLVGLSLPYCPCCCQVSCSWQTIQLMCALQTWAPLRPTVRTSTLCRSRPRRPILSKGPP